MQYTKSNVCYELMCLCAWSHVLGVLAKKCGTNTLGAKLWNEHLGAKTLEPTLTSTPTSAQAELGKVSY